ncbi:hypothetical protein KI387_030282, partial [Taxus chinensis]
GFNINSIPRKENKAADRHAVVGVAFDVVESIKEDKVKPDIHVIVRPSVPDNK